jgi:hypothetical protein
MVNLRNDKKRLSRDLHQRLLAGIEIPSIADGIMFVLNPMPATELDNTVPIGREEFP